MLKPSKKEILIGVGLAGAMIAAAALIALAVTWHPAQAPAPESKWSEEYWNQVHVSEYLAEKTWNGSAQVIRGGLGRVVVSVNGKAYEYKCVGVGNCTEGFVSDMD